MKNNFLNTFQDLPVLITGHTGFKGSWLSIWLKELGARIIGYSLEPPTIPSNFEVSHLAEHITDVRGNVRDFKTLRKMIEKYQPRVVFHLAAQAIVLESYKEPRETFDSNVGGTVNLLEAIRTTQSVKALVCITSDKCYENQDWIWSYREGDPLGGHDPYSASKAMAELSISSYRRSFFSEKKFSEHAVAIASVRAGNVIGGGDWAPYRLVPDCIRALTAGKQIHLRNPHHIRPWQHVFEPLSGYLWLAVKLLQKNGNRYAEAWNFGPLQFPDVSTEELVKRVIQLWGSGSYATGTAQAEVETELLKLNWEKAAYGLNWSPVYMADEALKETIEWYKMYYSEMQRSGSVNMYNFCVEQIEKYTENASHLDVEWVK